MQRPSLNDGGAGGWLRLDARTGQWTARGGTAESDLDPPIRVAIDFEAGVIGYEKWAGGTVERVTDTKPDGADWKQFWELDVVGEEPLIDLGDKPLGHRKFSSSSVMVMGELDRLAAEIERQDWSDGCLEVEIQKAIPVDTKMGKFFKPVFLIRGWVERPEALKEEGASV